jgi:hypothetical protein
MDEQSAALAGSRTVLVFAEDHVHPHGIRISVYRRGRLDSLVVRVYANAREVVAETRLHELPGLGVKRLTRRAEHVVHDRRHRRDLTVIDRPTLMLTGSLSAFVELVLPP